MEGCLELGKKLIRIVIIILIQITMFISSLCYHVSATAVNVKSGPVCSYQQQYNHIFDSISYTPYSEGEELNGVAVSTTGSFVLVYSSGITHYVDVYDSLGTFQREYIISEDGHVLATFDEHDNTILYLIRENILIKVGATGEYLSAASCLNKSELIDALSALDSFTTTCDGISYEFTGKNPFNSSSQMFTVRNAGGEILFQHVPNHGHSVWNIIPIMIALVFCGFWGIHRLWVKKQR